MPAVRGYLISTPGALATLPRADRKRSPVTTAWASKSLGPSTGLEVLLAGLLVREPSLKLAEACRERAAPRYATNGGLLKQADKHQRASGFNGKLRVELIHQ